jgi:uncharacterized delta-60 repeat protein
VTLACVVASFPLASAALANAGRAGHPDPSFDRDGTLVVGQAHGFANAVDVGPSGRIVVAGAHSVVRLLPSGRLDRSFADGGIASFESGAYAKRPSSVSGGPSSVAIGPDGGIFVAGTSCSDIDHCDFAVSRLKPDGELDPSFGNGGTARIGFTNPYSEALSIAIAPGGKPVVGGHSCVGASSCDFAIARLDRNGELDSSFGDGGKVTGTTGGCYYGLGGMALDSRDRIVVGGSCQLHIAVLARFNPDGDPDQSFGHGGTASRYVFIQHVDALAIDSHDRIDIAGRNHKGYGVDRFGGSGRYDFSFGDHGTARADFRGAQYVAARTAAIDSRGRIVVAGEAQDPGFRSTFGFARFKPDGRVDGRFGSHGTVEVAPRKGFRAADSVAIDRRDRIVGAGPHLGHGRKRFGLVRLLG